MTEAEWLACADPQKMLEVLQGKASKRKVRLLAVACALYLMGRIGVRSDCEAIRESERFADKQTGWKTLNAACKAAWASCHRTHEAGQVAIAQTLWVAAWAADRKVERAASHSVWGVQQYAGSDGNEWMCKIVRDLLGNPFRPVRLNPTIQAWNNGTVVRLAQGAYDERQMPVGILDNGRLAVLADALEEAGCTDTDILGHLRGPGPHVRGCWVVDLCLGTL